MKTNFSTLALAALALTSVFGFTSCDKNDDAFNNGSVANKSNHSVQQTQQTPDYVAPTPQTVSDAYLYIAATNDQLKYIDATYTISVDGQTKVVKLSDMNEVKDAKRLTYAATVFHVFDSIPTEKGDEKIEKGEAKAYEYHIGNVKKASIESINYTALSAKADHEINIIYGAEIKAGDRSLSVSSERVYRGIDDIAGFIGALDNKDYQ